MTCSLLRRFFSCSPSLSSESSESPSSSLVSSPSSSESSSDSDLNSLNSALFRPSSSSESSESSSSLSSNSTATPTSSSISSFSPFSSGFASSPAGVKSVIIFPTATNLANFSSDNSPTKLSTSSFRFLSFMESSFKVSSTSSAAPLNTSDGCSPNCSVMDFRSTSYAAFVSLVFGLYPTLKFISAESTSFFFISGPLFLFFPNVPPNASRASSPVSALRWFFFFFFPFFDDFASSLSFVFFVFFFRPSSSSSRCLARSPNAFASILPHKLSGIPDGSCARRSVLSACSTKDAFALYSYCRNRAARSAAPPTDSFSSPRLTPICR